MKNKTSYGGVLPHGLMSQEARGAVGGFNKTYKNTALRAGIIKRVIPTSSEENINKLAPEYDVTVIEQDENRAITPITYRNCVSREGLGSIADYFNAVLRGRTMDSSTDTPDFSGQDGTIVLLLALDANSDKGIIMGGLRHPDRGISLSGDGLGLIGEYNGVKIEIKDDGELIITSRGATDSKGKVKDEERTDTNVSMRADGAVSITREEFDINISAEGEYSSRFDSDFTSIIKGNENISVSKDSFFKSTNHSMNLKSLAVKASGSATFNVNSMSIKSTDKSSILGSIINIEGSAMVAIKASNVTIDGQVSVGGSGAQPAVIQSTIFQGTGNMGAPVISTSVGPYSSKVSIAS